MGCAPEASKPGQDLELRLREASPHCYTTHHGRVIAAAAYADDGRHYSEGAAPAYQGGKELDTGGSFSGNAANPTQSSLYATDFVEHSSTAQGRLEGFRPDGLMVNASDV